MARSAQAAPGISGSGTAPWLLTLLTFGCGLNLLDRQIINILAEPIKRDLGFADWQLGALSGLSFALLYSVAALPIARLADRSDRIRIVGVSIVAWSVFTALCGAAANFVQLLLLRVGVGIGEAGGGPASQSAIADSYPPEKRAGALAVYSLGAPIGASIGLIGGGLLGGAIGWRWTLVCAGLPGLVIGALVLATLRDPQSDAAAAAQPALGRVLRMLASRRAYVLMTLGSALHSFVNYGAMAFAGSFYLRVHADDLAWLSAISGIPRLGIVGLGMGLVGVSGGTLGALVGGRLGNRLGGASPRALAQIPAAGAVLCAMSYVAMFTVPTALSSFTLFFVASFFSNLWSGPGTLAMQRLAGPSAQATAMAVALFVNSAIGLSFGPLLMGAASDAFAPRLGEAEGLRAGILCGLVAGLIAGLLFWLASRRIEYELNEGTLS